MWKNTIVLLLHLIRRRKKEERINHLKQDQGIAPKKEKSPSPSSKPTKSGGGKQKNKDRYDFVTRSRFGLISSQTCDYCLEIKNKPFHLPMTRIEQIYWYSPLDQESRYHRKVDVWALGVSAIEMAEIQSSVRSTENDKYDKVGNNGTKSVLSNKECLDEGVKRVERTVTGSKNRSSVSNDESELNVAYGEKERKDDSDKMQVDHKQAYVEDRNESENRTRNKNNVKSYANATRDNMPQEINKRNNEKALNILLSAIPDRHLLSFHDAAVSLEDANLKFLRSLPSVWHVVATMIRGQPGLDELEFDDLYNNLKVYEHELKGVSKSSSQNIAFLSTEVKGSTLKQSTTDPANIPRGYTQAASSKMYTTPTYASHLDEIICSFFSQQASMPITHDDEDLLQIDEDAMEEIDIRWQVAMITARIRKFMRKTGRPIDLKPKNGITFDKSKIECFNCQKLGHFARECRFAKYQENRANGHQEKKTMAIEDSNSKA
ncbi:ribonuclease H-like domain-containing protein, partial [Tanacetum coccineum]